MRVCSTSVSLKQVILPTVCLFRRIRSCYNIHLGVKVSYSVKLAYTETAKDRNYFRYSQTPFHADTGSLDLWDCRSLPPGKGFRYDQVRFNPLNAELNPICHLLALLGGATIVVVSRLRVKTGSRYSLCDYVSRINTAVLQHKGSLLLLFTKLI